MTLTDVRSLSQPPEHRTPPDFRALLDAALASGTPVRISTVTKGRRYTHGMNYPARRIARIVEEKRVGAVIVFEDLGRVKVNEIVALVASVDAGGRL